MKQINNQCFFFFYHFFILLYHLVQTDTACTGASAPAKRLDAEIQNVQQLNAFTAEVGLDLASLRAAKRSAEQQQ
jgi:hypothetical protein